MNQWNSVQEVLDYAIHEEEAAAQFYSGLAGSVDKPWMKQTLEGFAQEELGHKAKLVKIQAGDALALSAGKIVDLKIGNYLVDVAPNPDMEYRDVLVIAMKKEKAAFKLYSDLAEAAADAALKATFLALAQEEARHKLRFEVEYDDVLPEN